MDMQRRSFFRSKLLSSTANIHLPWLTSVSTFYDRCTRCGECSESCAENIIVKGDGGYPVINFKHGECSFCQRCALVCSLGLFNTEKTAKPWDLVAEIAQTCLAYSGISCRTCQDSCLHNAISFSFQIGMAAQPNIDSQSCLGCGACVSPCPTEAITVLNENL